MRPPAGVHQLTNITNTRLHQAPSNSNPSLPVISPSPIIDKTTLKAVSVWCCILSERFSQIQEGHHSLPETVIAFFESCI